MAKTETHQDRAARIIATCKGKGPLSTHERLDLLEHLYDSLIFAWLENVQAGATQGSGAISYQLERARLEMVGLRANHGVIDATDHGLSIAGLDPALILVNGTGERIEA